MGSTIMMYFTHRTHSQQYFTHPVLEWLSALIYVKYDNTTEHILVFMLWLSFCCTVSTTEHQICCECDMAMIVLKKNNSNTVQKRNNLNTTTD